MPKPWRGKKYSPELVLAYIMEFKRKNDGLSPTVRQIMRHIGATSTSVVSHILNWLEGRSLIFMSPNGIIVRGGEWRLRE